MEHNYFRCSVQFLWGLMTLKLDLDHHTTVRKSQKESRVSFRDKSSANAGCIGPSSICKMAQREAAGDAMGLMSPAASDTRGGNELKTDKVVKMHQQELKKARVLVNDFLEKNRFIVGEPNRKRSSRLPFSTTYPLHEAIKQNDAYITAKLLLFGADPNHKDKWGCTAYYYASKAGDDIKMIFEEHVRRTTIPEKSSSLYRWQHCPPPRGFEVFFANLEDDPLVQVQSCEKEWLLILGRRRLRNDWAAYHILEPWAYMNLQEQKHSNTMSQIVSIIYSDSMFSCFLQLSWLNIFIFQWISMISFEFCLNSSCELQLQRPGECTAQVFHWLEPSKIGYVNGEGWCSCWGTSTKNWWQVRKGSFG